MISVDTLIRSRNKYYAPNMSIFLKHVLRIFQLQNFLRIWYGLQVEVQIVWFTCYLQLSCTTGPAKLVLCPTRIVRHVSGIDVQNKQVPVLQHPDTGGGVPGVQIELHIVLQPGVSGRRRSFRITRICDIPANDTKHDVNQGLFDERWGESCRAYKPCFKQWCKLKFVLLLLNLKVRSIYHINKSNGFL